MNGPSMNGFGAEFLRGALDVSPEGVVICEAEGDKHKAPHKAQTALRGRGGWSGERGLSVRAGERADPETGPARAPCV